MEQVEDVSRKGKAKIFLSIISGLIIVSLIAGILVYRNNKNFKTRVNKILAKLPGSVGERFVEDEVGDMDGEKINELAKYYLSLDSDHAADKIYIVKHQNEQLFDTVIKSMNSSSPTKTEEILKMVRALEIRKKNLSGIYGEIQEKNEDEIYSQASRFEGMATDMAVVELEQKIELDKNFFEKAPLVMAVMDEKKAAEILYYMDSDIRDEILKNMDDAKRSKLDAIVLKKESEENKYADIARLYESKSIEDAVEEIGSTEIYEMEELGKIYSNLDIQRSAEVLSRVQDDEFIEKLFEQIRVEDELKRLETPVTSQLSEAIQFVSEYNKKIKELANIYEGMSADKVATIVENMMENAETVTSLEIDSEPIYEISDATIVMDVLANMRRKTLSKIMNNMSTENSSILTQKIIDHDS